MPLVNNSDELIFVLEKISGAVSFPEEEKVIPFLEKSVTALENENVIFRKPASDKKCGGLLDFTKLNLPVILVPDLHGRFDFFLSILKYVPDFSRKKSVASLIENKEAVLLCVGDSVHSEKRGAERWLNALDDYEKGNILNDYLKEEMLENLKTLFFIMLTKNTFSDSFYFLKGNHENILNENTDGNYAFYKYALESEMTNRFVKEFYSDAVLHLLSEWEKNLPVCAAFKSFCVSHAEPAHFFKKKQIVNFRGNDELIKSFTWTENDAADKNTVPRIFHELTGLSEKDALWFSGHRPVRGKFYYRQEGHLIQFHNPCETNIALILPDKKFNPEEDIVSVKV